MYTKTLSNIYTAQVTQAKHKHFKPPPPVSLSPVSLERRASQFLFAITTIAINQPPSMTSPPARHSFAGDGERRSATARDNTTCHHTMHSCNSAVERVNYIRPTPETQSFTHRLRISHLLYATIILGKTRTISTHHKNSCAHAKTFYNGLHATLPRDDHTRYATKPTGQRAYTIFESHTVTATHTTNTPTPQSMLVFPTKLAQLAHGPRRRTEKDSTNCFFPLQPTCSSCVLLPTFE